MSSAKQNNHIARLIVGAMCIDGSLDKEERKKVSCILEDLGMIELIADVGIALDADEGDFNLFEECDLLLASLGSIASEVAPLIFRIVADVVASDRFVSTHEVTYLSALSRRLGIQATIAAKIFQQVLAHTRGRLEISSKQVDININPYLKELLSFPGADFLTGRDYAAEAAALKQEPKGEPKKEPEKEPKKEPKKEIAEPELSVSPEELVRAFAVLGLEQNANKAQAEEVWRETITHLDLPKMADLGETFVSAAVNRITRINEAYKAVLRSGRR